METYIGERKLLCAVIEQAYTDATGRGWQKKDAQEWLNSEGNDPFSFIWICDQLQIDPSIIRRNIKSIAENNWGLNRSAVFNDLKEDIQLKTSPNEANNESFKVFLKDNG